MSRIIPFQQEFAELLKQRMTEVGIQPIGSEPENIIIQSKSSPMRNQ